MRPGARAQAAIEVLADVEARKRPAADALKDWMLSHRFAGSKDRAEIGDLVFGAMRWRASSSYRFGESHPRAWVWGAQRWGFGVSAEDIERSCYEPHAPPPPTEAERMALAEGTPVSRLEDAPSHVRGDFPDWLEPSLAATFGAATAEEGAALAAPAPLDLRSNTLKTTREALITALQQSPRLREPPAITPYAPHGVRIPWAQGRTFPWATEQSFLKGWFEVQDEGSQIAASLAEAAPGDQVADVCAGGGGKTLALAAAMGNRGQVYAFDVDGRRLAPLSGRLERAGVRNAQIRTPLREADALADLVGRMDLVFIDAPCTGSGTWRRAPDSKWRLRPGALQKRLEEQQQALALGAPLVRPGGRLVYVTCSVLEEENDGALARFLASNPEFSPRASAIAPPAHQRRFGLQFSPLKTGCDGFYVALLTRKR
jgi:16S rRNA (cytosine967-C5)-methyltransferase